MRNYKRVSDCPLRLRQIIDAVNCLPYDTKPIEKRLYEMLFEGADEETSQEQQFKEIEGLIKEKSILNYVFLNTSAYFSFFTVFDNFFDLLTAAKILHSIAATLDGNPVGLLESPVEISQTFYLDKKGNIRPRNSGLIEIFSDYDVPFNRIRVCPVCEQFFWAKRIDAKSCGKNQCSDILSQRNLRKKKRSEINEQRRENYKQRKKLKEMRSKK